MAQGAVPERKTGTLGGGAPEPWFPRLSRGHNASPYLTGKLRAFDDKPWDKCAEGCRARQPESFRDTEVRRAACLPRPPWQQVSTPRLWSQAWDITAVDTVMGAIRRSQLRE